MGVEEQIIAAGAQLIYVLEEDYSSNPGLASTCRTILDEDPFFSDAGLCVGDAQTQPIGGVFDQSPFSDARGFDMIVVRDTMEIVFTTSHGTGGTNENITGEELLAEVQAVIAGL